MPPKVILKSLLFIKKLNNRERDRIGSAFYRVSADSGRFPRSRKFSTRANASSRVYPSCSIKNVTAQFTWLLKSMLKSSMSSIGRGSTSLGTSSTKNCSCSKKGEYCDSVKIISCIDTLSPLPTANVRLSRRAPITNMTHTTAFRIRSYSSMFSADSRVDMSLFNGHVKVNE